LGIAIALAACQSAPEANNQTAATPAPAAAPETPVAIAERLIRARVAAQGEPRFEQAALRNHQGVNVVCGAYSQGQARHRYIVVNGEDVFVEPEMAAGEMPRAINEFCGEGGRA
jgi:hypothetical protein